MSDSLSFDLAFTGEFSLGKSVGLAMSAGFVNNTKPPGTHNQDGLDLAFMVDGLWSPIAASIIERDGGLRALVHSNAGGIALQTVKSQLERILSLDGDGNGFGSICSLDRVIARIRSRNAGIRPVLFPSPYEAAARAIIGHGLVARQAAAIHGYIAKQYGPTFEVGQRSLHAFPSPERLAQLPAIRSLSNRKIDQLRALGHSAADGFLDMEKLCSMRRDDVLKHLQQLRGVGPFSAELILIRGIGDADAFPREEKTLQRAMILAYGLGENPSLAEFDRIAEKWRPYRSWVGLLLRNFVTS